MEQNDHYLLFLNVSYSFSILRPLCNAIKKRGGTPAWYLHELDASFLQKDDIHLKTVREVKAFNPKAVFIPGNWVPDFFPGVKVEVFHGFGIEKKGHFDIRGFFDLYCTHGPLTTHPFKALEKTHGYFKVMETGWPKMDTLFLNKPQKTFRDTHNIDKPIILYAPTFSPRLCSATALFQEISDLSNKGSFHWLVKFHPLMDKEIVKIYRSLKKPGFDFIEDPDILPWLHAADVMLTDTSSVVAEFLLLQKPVITFKTMRPGPQMSNFTEAAQLEEKIKFALHPKSQFKKAASEYIHQMHPYVDGGSSERILNATDHFIETCSGKLKKKPLNLWRKFQVRKRMGYYKIN